MDCFGLGPVDFSLTARRLQTWGPVLQKFISERRAPWVTKGLAKEGGKGWERFRTVLMARYAFSFFLFGWIISRFLMF